MRIDGKARAVDFFELIAAGSANEELQLAAARGLNGGSSGSKSSAVVPLDRGRTIFFYVDDFHMAHGNLTWIRKMLNKYVEQNLGQNDMAAITSASGSIGFLQQLSDNKAVLRAAIDRLLPRSTLTRDLERPPMSEYQALQIDRMDHDVTGYFVDELVRNNPMLSRQAAEEAVRGRARQILQYSANYTTNTLAGLEKMVRASSKLPGRKLLIFISDGFFLDERNSDSLSRVRRVTSAAARNGVVIYSMDARGLVASLEDPSAGVTFDPSGRLQRGSSGELVSSQDGMNALAKDTGGRTIFNTNALDVGLNTALKETSVYYLLAWRPDPESASDKFRKISVNLIGHPDWTVRVRQGFFDRDPAPAPRTSATQPSKPANEANSPEEVALRNALTETFPSTGLPIAASLGYLDTPEKGMMLAVSTQLSADSLHLIQDGPLIKGQVDLRGVVYNDEGKVGASFGDRLTLTTASLAQLQRTNREMVYNYRVFLTHGLYQVRVAARDPVTGKTGSAYQWIEIPNLAKRQLTLSTVLAAERLPNSSDIANANLNPAGGATLRVDHRFHRNSVLRFVFCVYNAAKSAVDAKPDLGMQVQVLRDQEPVVTTPSKKIATDGLEDQLDRLPAGGDLSLEGLAPGHYILQISVVDRVSKSSAIQQVRFYIQ